MVLPTFVVIGATKSGTTALHEYLSAHPRVFTPTTKELRFFSSPERWRRGVSWYESQFAGAGDAPARGESSPQYTHAPLVDGVPGRMAGVLPEATLVYLVRDPVARVLSQYRYRINRGRERRPPEEALQDPRYLDGSRYAYQLDQYLEHYDASALHVVTSEDLRRDQEAVVRRVLEAIGAGPPSGSVPAAEVNVGDDKRRTAPVPRPVRRVLRALVPLGLSPQTAHRLSRRPVRRPTAPAPEVPPWVHRRLEDALRADAERMRSWVGDAVDAWGLLRAGADRPTSADVPASRGPGAALA